MPLKALFVGAVVVRGLHPEQEAWGLNGALVFSPSTSFLWCHFTFRLDLHHIPQRGDFPAHSAGHFGEWHFTFIPALLNDVLTV